MKAIRFFAFISCCLWGEVAYSQTMTGYELWFDDDCNSRVSVSGGSQMETSLDVSSLSANFHRLQMRAKDSEDRWSVTACKYFYYNPYVLPSDGDITVEYWIDDDANTRQSVESSGSILEMTVDVSSLTEGFHRLALRAKDSEGHWSVTACNYFYYNPFVLPTDSAMTVEYWIDDDANTRQSVESSGGIVEMTVNVSSLTEGFHRLALRAKDSEDRWSVTASKYFYYNPFVLPTDSAMTVEYWIDDDANTRQSVESSGSIVEMTVDVSSLSEGFHRLALRAKDSEDHCSVTASKYFYYNPDVLPADSAVTYEYWIDDDYEARVNGSSSDGIILFDLQVDQLSYSVHRLHVRAQDSNGNWSVTACRYFLCPYVWLDGNMISGYKYWANGVLEAEVELDEANPYTNDNLLIDITGVVPLELTSDYSMDWATKTVTSPGDLYFAISFGDKAGQWSTPAIDTVYYDYPQEVEVEEMYNVASSDITSARKGRMYGFHYNISEGSSIIWTVDSACCVDIYVDFGNRTSHHEMPAEGGTIEVEAATEGSYAFVYNIEGDHLTVTSRSDLLNGIASAIADDMVEVDGNQVTVNASGVTCRVYDTRGILYMSVTTSASGETFTLPSGVYIMTLTDTARRSSKLKLLIP